MYFFSIFIFIIIIIIIIFFFWGGGAITQFRLLFESLKSDGSFFLSIVEYG